MSEVDFYITGVIDSTVARVVDNLETNRNNEITVKIICPEKSQICGDYFMISDGRVIRGSWCYAQYKDYIITDFELECNCSSRPVLMLNVREPRQNFYIDEFMCARPATELTNYSLCYSEARKFKVERVMVNGPATIVFWKDGTKTVAKCLPEDKFDLEKGIAICFMKKASKESCVKIFENARKDILKKLQDELEKLNKELEKKKCSEDATSTS